LAPPTARWQGGCYCWCKARLLSPHALILILILISLAAPQAPTASTDPQHRHPCRRFLVACPLLQLRLQFQLSACARQAPVLSPLLLTSPHLTSPSPSPSPSPRSPHCLDPPIAPSPALSSLPLDATAWAPTLVPASILRRAPCDFLLRRPAACGCLPPLQSFHASLAPPSRNRHPEHASALTPARCVPPTTLSHILCKRPFALRRRAAVTNHRARTVAACERVSPGTALQGPTSLTSTLAPHPSLPHTPHISPPASAHT
jgi:hypothetical protein